MAILLLKPMGENNALLFQFLVFAAVLDIAHLIDVPLALFLSSHGHFSSCVCVSSRSILLCVCVCVQISIF